jgi:hydrogenase maturation factor
VSGPSQREMRQIGSNCLPDHGCITCGDVAIEVRVLRVDEERELALCSDREGRRSSVEVALVGPVGVGEQLLVHAGTAIARLDAEAVAG